MIDDPSDTARFDRRWLWSGLIAILGAVAALIRVPTRLGVQVPETSIRGIDASQIDRSGSEQIWRVWWRGYDDFVTVHPQWVLSLGLLVLLVIFVAGLLMAVWIALSPESGSPRGTE